MKINHRLHYTIDWQYFKTLVYFLKPNKPPNLGGHEADEPSVSEFSKLQKIRTLNLGV